VYDELMKFGDVEELNICENLGDHMVGNVYAKFFDEEKADDALKALLGRFYAGRPLIVEFSPVTDFREVRDRRARECRAKSSRKRLVSHASESHATDAGARCVQRVERWGG